MHTMRLCSNERLPVCNRTTQVHIPSQKFSCYCWTKNNVSYTICPFSICIVYIFVTRLLENTSTSYFQTNCFAAKNAKSDNLQAVCYCKFRPQKRREKHSPPKSQARRPLFKSKSNIIEVTPVSPTREEQPKNTPSLAPKRLNFSMSSPEVGFT